MPASAGLKNASAAARTGNARAQLWKCALAAALGAASTVALLNAAVATYFPPTSRLDTSFSPGDLQHEISAIASAPGRETLFLGDSLLWGFQIAPEQTAVAVLARAGCACRNLAYKHGSPPNYYALVRTLQASGARPRAMVIEVNRELFSLRTGGYRRVADSVAAVSAPYLTAADRRELELPKAGLRARFDRMLASISLLYAKRVDIHIAIYGDTIAPFSAELIRRLYDLPPLRESNVSVRYLEKTLDLLDAARTPVVAFLVPINHAAIDPHVDAAAYRRNTVVLEKLLARHRAHVLDLDSSFVAGEFLDEQHLTPAGQRRLAALLGEALRRAGVTPYAASTNSGDRPRRSDP